MNIVIASSGLFYAKGGTCRIAADLANEMLRRGHKVYLYSTNFNDQPVFNLEPQVKTYLTTVDALAFGEYKTIAKTCQKLIKDQIDVFLSLHSNGAHMFWALCCKGSGVPFICSERNDPHFSEAVTWSKPGRMAVLACADNINELLPVYVETVPKIWQDKVSIIPNPAPQTPLLANVTKKDGQKTLLFLARYAKHKRAGLLIKAFALLAKDFKDWTLKLVGHGPEYYNLQKLIQKLKLEQQVKLNGVTSDAFSEYAKAQIYCLPTRFEGFPNTVLEAMSAGLPIIGLNDCPAMTSIVKPSFGILANPTAESLANTLRPLLESAELREKLGQNALKECQINYNREKIFDLWEQLLQDTAKLKGQVIMNELETEPFATMAYLSTKARQEYIEREFGEIMPYSPLWFKERVCNFASNLFNI